MWRGRAFSEHLSCNLRILRIFLREMRKPILDALFPKTRQAVLCAFVLHPDKWWYLTDLARHLKVSPSSLQRELVSLVESEVLLHRKDGNRAYYQVNKACPIIGELQNIFVKTIGIADVISSSLKKLGQKIEIAFIYGPVARTEELSTSDVDLMIIGDAGLADITPRLRRAETTLEREVNPTVYSTHEFARKRSEGDSFIDTVMSDSKIFLKGSTRELEALGQ